MASTIFTVGDFVRRVVDSLLRGDCRGKFLCSRCLVKMTKDHLDKSYTTREVAEVMDEIFKAPGSIVHASASTCAACARKKLPCLGAASA
jgi:ferredoxin